MKTLKGLMVGAVVAASLASTCALADTIPYPNPGTTNPTTYSFIAPYAGNISAYFYSASASYDETIGLWVNGVSTGIIGLPNHASSLGQELILGFAPAGATLVFTLQVQNTGDVFYSNPAQNPDGFNHVYSTSFSGSPSVPGGTFVSFEDLYGGGDKDYNDIAFVFRDVGVVAEVPAAPEISTWLMMLLGFAGVGFAAYRRNGKFSKSIVAA